MAVTKIKPIKSTLSKALDYIENPDKTDGKMLVSSFGCSYETADIEFEYTLSQALQKKKVCPSLILKMILIKLFGLFIMNLCLKYVLKLILLQLIF